MFGSAVFLSWASGACYAYTESLRGEKGGFPFKKHQVTFNDILTFLDFLKKRNALCLWTCNLWNFGRQDERTGRKKKNIRIIISHSLLFLVCCHYFSFRLPSCWTCDTLLIDTPGAPAGDFLYLLSTCCCVYCMCLSTEFILVELIWHGCVIPNSAYSTVDCMHVCIYALWIVWNAYIVAVCPYILM